MTKDIRLLATKYIDEVINDQRRLGYTGRVRSATREKAITDTQAALRGLEVSITDSKRAKAA